jgi:rare lipoprotein A
LPDRYTGRHIRQARHGAWLRKKRSLIAARQHQLLPAAAALTVAGLLVGAAGTAIRLAAPGSTDDLASNYDPADYLPPDRDAAVDRGSRNDARGNARSTDAPPPSTTSPPDASPPDTKTVSNQVVTTGSCRVSYYDGRQRTANGETLDAGALTAAHRSLPFDSRVRVTNVATGQSVVVRINDRGPYVSGRCLNLSRAAFDTIGDLDAGVLSARYEVLAADAT